MENQRHYIFINPENLGSKSDDPHLKVIKQWHATEYRHDEEIIYWSYSDIENLLERYDPELRSLFVKINVNYPALIADIGKYIILYFHGGVYHDLKFVSKEAIIPFIASQRNNGVTFIGDTRPKSTGIEPRPVRSGNIVSLTEKHELLDTVLQRIRSELIQAQHNNYFGARKVWSIGSQIYIDTFKEFKSSQVIQELMTFVTSNQEIYKMRFKKWQTTEEYLFSTK